MYRNQYRSGCARWARVEAHRIRYRAAASPLGSKGGHRRGEFESLENRLKDIEQRWWWWLERMICDFSGRDETRGSSQVTRRVTLSARARALPGPWSQRTLHRTTALATSKLQGFL